MLSEVSLDQATDACFRRWICITTWTHWSSGRRPPGWCESFDGCMSKLPEASVGAATGSCGLPDAMVGDAAVSPGLTRSAGVAGSAEDCEGCGVRV